MWAYHTSSSSRSAVAHRGLGRRAAHLNCAAPTKVGDDVMTGEPVCDFGRGLKSASRPLDPDQRLLAQRHPHPQWPRLRDWQDYHHGEFDIQLARSTDRGRTWSATHTVNPDRGLDHYFPAVGVAETAGRARVGDSYFRSQRAPGRTPRPRTGPPRPRPRRPGVRAPDGVQAGFNGDYSGLTINFDIQAHPVWSDTRNRDPFAPTTASPGRGLLHGQPQPALR